MWKPTRGLQNVTGRLNRLDEALRYDPEPARAALQDGIAESVTLQSDKSGKYLWVEYEMKTAALLGVAGGGETVLVVAGSGFGTLQVVFNLAA